MSQTDYNDFKKLVKLHGYKINESGTDHSRAIEDKAGNFLMSFATKHKSGSKKTVKQAYVIRFLRAVEAQKRKQRE